MKLTKDTKKDLKIGDILKANKTLYIVTNIWASANGRCMYATIQDTETKQSLYGTPVSSLYDMEIIKGGCKICLS